MKSDAATVEQYLEELPPERRTVIEAVRQVILDNLPAGVEEGMQYGMIGYFVPHSVYPPGYHCDPSQPLPFACLASQKNHLAVYLACVYMNPAHEAWLREAWAKTGKKLDMGKSCLRFKRLEDVPLKVLGQAVKRMPVKKFIKFYETATAGQAGKRKRKDASEQQTAGPQKRPAAKRPATKRTKTTAKKTSVKGKRS